MVQVAKQLLEINGGEPLRPEGFQTLGSPGTVHLSHKESEGKVFLLNPCDCVSTFSVTHVNREVFDEYREADVYVERAKHSRAYDVPGTATLHDCVVNIYQQLLPGGSIMLHKNSKNEQTYVSATRAKQDTEKGRLEWFRECLSYLDRILPSSGLTLLVPMEIGFDCLGEKKPNYYELVHKLSEVHSNWKIIYCDSDYHFGEKKEVLREQPSAEDSEISSYKLPVAISEEQKIDVPRTHEEIKRQLGNIHGAAVRAVQR